MPPAKSSFLDKVLGRIGRLDPEGLQTVVQRLARERRFLETVFDVIEDAVVVVDEQGRVLYWNRAATQLLGVVEGEGEGELLTRWIPELDWDGLAALDREGGGRVARYEFEVVYPRRRFLRLYAAPLDGEAAGSSGMVLILHDATEARQKTQEAIESERAQALTLLAASVAHEIGNPLNALHIHLQLIERELRKLTAAAMPPAPRLMGRRRRRVEDAEPAAGDAAQATASKRIADYLGVAKGEVARLDYIITQFLQALRPSAPRLAPASLNAVVHATLELLGPELENRGLKVERELASGLPEAPLDAAQLKQVLVNLVKNAMQAMTRGGVLTLRTGVTADGVWVSVADTGGGVPAEKINRIFEPFYTTKKRGTGLGLLIVQRIVRDHGGRIELENHAGKGATFRVWIPLHGPAPRLLGGSAAGATVEAGSA